MRSVCTPVAKLAVVAAVSTLVVGLLVGTTGAPALGSTARAWAPLTQAGPALSVPSASLTKAVACSGPFRGNNLEPVLLEPATGVTPTENYSWNWERVFTAQHRPWCAVTEPFHTLGDLQVGGEYVVYAIRRLHALTGRKIAVMGHSQGGQTMRWALRFWPDTRSMVDDVIGMAGDNHGTTLLDGFCVASLTTCTPQGWQQRSTSNYLRALNSVTETFAGISYTEIYSHNDEVVLPSTGPRPSSALHSGAGLITNVATQDLCPSDVYEHLAVGTIDPVTYALATDALSHPGPALPSRISRSACSQILMPGVSAAAAQQNLSLLGGLPNVLLVPVPFVNLGGAPQLSNEPALACYVYAGGCRGR
ncbi:hypothetical protein Back2_18570 [Nocardioides baekrokdamisoli]|uniref:Lipase n=1 Tax=Nocardioides baekrokdamisoli TaxID=1804624 RepID=A0A3G9IEZ7_9ACTN|nr:lipase [Nocardioides baekrokdamisoli]BBH17570.1 hypothetical protein Back2_18570 [Nocardioides baekrokdamisoli]